MNISSFAGFNVVANLVPYCATKAFNKQFSLGMNLEYGSHVDVLTVYPNRTKTNMYGGYELFTI